MKSLTFLFVFLLLGSFIATLGQTSNPAVLRPGGVFTISSAQPLCGLPTAIAIVGVNRTLSDPLTSELGGCRVRITQSSTGETLAPLQLAHTLLLPFFGAAPSSTLIVGVVPPTLVQGSASLIVEKLMPRSVGGKVEQVVVGTVTIAVDIGAPAIRLAQLGLSGDTTDIVQ